jgi:hypothetical protein
MTLCTYCGELANTIDHIPPQSRRAGLEGVYPFLEVPACKSCNSGLGARPLMRLEDRQQWIHGWLQRHYVKILTLPEWSERELEELGPTLRQKVGRGLAQKRATLARIEFSRPKV